MVPDSDAEDYVERRFPNKKTKRIGNGLRTRTIKAFLTGLRLIFQRNRSEGLDATYHFTFTGEEETTATVTIRDKTIDVQTGHIGASSVHVRGDSRTWLAVMAKEQSLVWALIRGKIRIKGSPKLFIAFGKCFPS